MKILPLYANHFPPSSALYAYGQMTAARDRTYMIDGVARRLVQGQDFGGQIYIDEAAFPNNTGIGWLAPKVAPPGGGVAGYICVGRNRMWNTAVKKPDPIKPITSMLELLVSWKAQLAVAPGGDANFMIDVMPYLGDPGVKDAKGDFVNKPAMELMVHLAIGDIGRGWAMGLPAVRKGIFEENGRRWNVRGRDGVYLAFPDPGVQYLEGALDLKDFFDFLQGAGIVTPPMNYVGLQIGAEAVVGGGFLRLDELAIGAP